MSPTPYSKRQIQALVRSAEELHVTKSARVRLSWFLFAAGHDWNVSMTCRHFGIARTTFVRWLKRFDIKNPESLEEYTRRPHTLQYAAEDKDTIAHIERLRREDPYVGKEVIRKKLLEEHGIHLSASTIGRIIQRHCFFFGSSPAHLSKQAQGNDRLHADKANFTERDHTGAQSASIDSLPIFGT